MYSALIIDYGMGNLQSVKRAFEECGARAFISDNPKEVKSATHIVLPGVGSFCDGMKNLEKAGWPDALRHETRENEIPLLGICLGMQLLADKGNEGGETFGLGLIPGDVRKFKPDGRDIRIPHMGWNEIYPIDREPLFYEISGGTDFYFVHSYHFEPVDVKHAIAKTPYCGNFTSAVRKKNVSGVQFHPEKSHKAGFQVIRNFLSCH